MTCGNYDNVFINNLIKQLDNKIAFIADKDYKNSIYNLGLCGSIKEYKKLLRLRNILDKILKCDSCYAGMDIENIVSIAKNLINA